MSKKLWTVDQFKNYLLKQESRGDIMYNLSDENIELANLKQWKCIETTEDMEYFIDDTIFEEAYEELSDMDKLRFKQIN